MSSSISRQLILRLAVPLTLLALAGALAHDFNNVAPQVISTDHRLRACSVELLAAVERGDAAAAAFQPTDHAIRFAVRDGARAMLAGDPSLPAALRSVEGSPLYTTVRSGARQPAPAQPAHRHGRIDPLPRARR